MCKWDKESWMKAAERVQEYKKAEFIGVCYGFSTGELEIEGYGWELNR